MQKEKSSEKIFQTVMPYLVFGITIAIAISLVVIFFYLFVWGIIIGFVLWAVVTLKEKFFPSKKVITYTQEVDGRVTIEESVVYSSHQRKNRGQR